MLADHGGKEFVIYLISEEDDWRFSSRQMNTSKGDLERLM